MVNGDPAIPSISIPPFRGLATPKAPVSNPQEVTDVMLNACGPIWALDMAPELQGELLHLAVGTSIISASCSTSVDRDIMQGVPGAVPLFEIGRPTRGPNLLQVWQVRPANNKSPCGARMAYGVALDSGPLWDAHWACPTIFQVAGLHAERKEDCDIDPQGFSSPMV